MLSIHVIVLSWFSTSVQGAWNFFQGQGSWRLKLVAWSLSLYACRLMLAACSFKSLALEACCLGLVAWGPDQDARQHAELPLFLANDLIQIPRGNFVLMFTIFNCFDVAVPACPAVSAFIVLLSCGTRRASCNNFWRVGPRLRRPLVHHRGAKSYD